MALFRLRGDSDVNAVLGQVMEASGGFAEARDEPAVVRAQPEELAYLLDGVDGSRVDLRDGGYLLGIHC